MRNESLSSGDTEDGRVDAVHVFREAVVDDVCHCQLPAIFGHDGQQPGSVAEPLVPLRRERWQSENHTIQCFTLDGIGRVAEPLVPLRRER